MNSKVNITIQSKPTPGGPVCLPTLETLFASSRHYNWIEDKGI